MTRVFCAALATETNTFGPLPTERRHFEDWFLYPAGTHPTEPTLFTAPLTLARTQAKARNWEVHEGLCAAAFPSGRVVRADYEALRDRLLDDLKAALPLDIVLLGLHGAMAADGYDDCEGDLLRRVRTLVGPDCVIGAELDPHCHLSEAMLEASTVLLAFQEYPHTDSEIRAQTLLDICDRAQSGDVRPVTAVLDLRMSAQFFTQSEPSKNLVEQMKAMEQDGRVLAASLGHSFASGDVADMSAKVWVVTDGDPDMAQQCVRELADAIWRIRDEADPGRLDAGEAIAKVRQTEGLCVLAEGADNPGGGAPGDATGLIRSVMVADLGKVAVGPIWDPGAVDICAAKGVGAVFPLRFGGKASALSGAPLDLTVEILAITHNVVQDFGGNPWPLGTVVGLRSGSTEFALSSLRNQALTLTLFDAAGIDVHDKRALILKSNHHFSAAFGPIAEAILYMNTPGVAVVNPRLAPYQTIQRPLWPLDAAGMAKTAQTLEIYA